MKQSDLFVGGHLKIEQSHRTKPMLKSCHDGEFHLDDEKQIFEGNFLSEISFVGRPFTSFFVFFSLVSRTGNVTTTMRLHLLLSVTLFVTICHAYPKTG